VNGFEEFQPVAVRVLGINPAHPREPIIEQNGSTRAAKPVSPGVQIVDQQARMCLASRTEVVLHAQVQVVTAVDRGNVLSARVRFRTPQYAARCAR
jgi:hypothetical protein